MTETNITNNTETESSVYPVEQAYAETPKRSAKKTFSLANVATLEVDASKNIISTTIDVTDEICTAPLPLSLVCTEDGRFFKLNVDESMGICTFDDGSQGYVYTDAKGQKLLFKELLYKVSDSGDKYYVNKQRSDITLKDGALYDEEDGKQVFIEYRQKDGWTVVPKIEGFKGIELIDTRSEEEKQYEEQYKYYKDILDNYVLVEKSTTDGVETITITPIYENGYNGEEAPTLLSNSEEGTEQFILQKSDALTYETLIAELQVLYAQKEESHVKLPQLREELKYVIFKLESLNKSSSNNLEIVKAIITPSADLAQNYEQAKNFVIISYDLSRPAAQSVYLKTFPDSSSPITEIINFKNFAEDEDNRIILTKDEAASFESLLLQKSMLEDEITKLGDSDYSTESDPQVDGKTIKVLKDRISALESQKEYFEGKAETMPVELEKCRKEYATAKLNYDTYISTKTEFAITNGTIIKAFNKEGKLVSIIGGQEEVKISRLPNNGMISELSDESGNYISFTYYEDMGEDVLLKSISTFSGKNMHFTYLQSIENGVIDTISLSSNGIDIATIVNNSDKKVASITSNIENVREEFTYENGKIKSVKQIFINTESGIESDVRQLYFAEESIDPYKHYFAINYDLKESEFWEVDYTGRVLKHFVEGQHSKLKEYQEYEYVPYWYITTPNDNPCDVISVANKQGLLDINVHSQEAQTIKGTKTSCTLNTFNNPIIEEVTGEDLTNKGIQKIVTNFTYDDMQNVIKKTETVTLIDSTVSHVTHTIYEYANSVLVKEVSYVEGEENTNGKNVTEYEYSEDGKVKKVLYNTLQSSDKICEESIYDKNGLKLCDFDITGRHKIEYAYNKDKSVREISLPNGTKLAYGYDSYGNVTSISQSTIDGIENSTDRTYSGGKIVELRSGNNKVNYTYDSKQRVIDVKVNGTSVAYHTYSEVESLTVPKGESTITYTDVDKENVDRGFSSYTSYKGKDGKLLKAEVNGYDLNYEYDNKDNVTKINDTFHIRTDSYEYDDKNRLTNYNRYYIETEDYTESITYDDFGNVTTVCNSENQAYAYTYKDDSTKALEKTVIYGYNIYPNTDCNGRNIGKDIQCNGSSISKQKIEYLKVGDHTTNFPSRITYANNDSAALGNITMSIKYSYNNMGNVSKIYKNGLLTTRYTYDGLNRLIREDNRDFGKTYRIDYDDKGNITGKYTYNFTLCSMDDLYEKTPTATQTYEYDLQSDRLHAINGNIIGYDMYGFPSRYGLDGQFCTWYDNYLSGYGSNTFVRDNRGRRIKKNNILFIYDSQDRVIKQSNGVEFFYDHTGVAGISYNGTLYTYEKDVFGNVISILDRDGRRMVQYMYDAWGNHKIVDGYGNTITSSTHIGNINPIRYRSYYYDTETGLYYLQARYYDPVIGRFISPDDVDYIDPEVINGLNLYAYCGNNPVMNIDPTGHSAVIIGLIIGAIIGVVVGFGVAVYIDYQDDGIIFNGSVAWYAYLSATILGGIIGAGIGAGIGYVAPYIGSALSSFASSSFTFGGGISISASGGVAAAGVTISGAQILTGLAVLGGIGIMFSKNANRFGKSKIGSNSYYNKQFNKFWRKFGNGNKDTRDSFHRFITKKGYDTWKQLLEQWNKFLKKYK